MKLQFSCAPSEYRHATQFPYTILIFIVLGGTWLCHVLVQMSNVKLMLKYSLCVFITQSME